jgi:hypothetical protein
MARCSRANTGWLCQLASPAAVPGQLFARAVSFPPRKAVQSAAQTTPPVWSRPTLRESLDERAPSIQPKSDHHALWPVIHTRNSHRSGVCPGSFSEIPPGLPATGSPAIQTAHRRPAGCKPKDNLAGFCLSHPGPNIGSGFRRLAGNCPASKSSRIDRYTGFNNSAACSTQHPIVLRLSSTPNCWRNIFSCR